jgi:hypothetical protein
MSTLTDILASFVSDEQVPFTKSAVTRVVGQLIEGRGMESILNRIADSGSPNIVKFRVACKAAAAKQGILIQDLSALLRAWADCAKELSP